VGPRRRRFTHLTGHIHAICLHTSGHLASVRERATYLIGGLGRIVDLKRGRQSAAKEQPHREVGTQSRGPRLSRWPGYPRYRDVSALFSAQRLAGFGCFRIRKA
jgi:hypothetical protein